MKITVRIMIPFMLLCAAAFLLHSCVATDEPCRPVETKIYPIEKKLRDSIPYTGYDTLTFIRKTVGDTHVFIGENPIDGYDVTTEMKTREDCPPNNAKMGRLIYTYASSTYASKITFDVYSLNYQGIPYVAIRFDGQKFEENSANLSAPYDYNALQIGGQMYYNLEAFSDPDVPTDEYFALYNATYGIVKFKFKNGEEWELLSKK